MSSLGPRFTLRDHAPSFLQLAGCRPQASGPSFSGFFRLVRRWSLSNPPAFSPPLRFLHFPPPPFFPPPELACLFLPVFIPPFFATSKSCCLKVALAPFIYSVLRLLSLPPHFVPPPTFWRSMNWQPCLVFFLFPLQSELQPFLPPVV